MVPVSTSFAFGFDLTVYFWCGGTFVPRTGKSRLNRISSEYQAVAMRFFMQHVKKVHNVCIKKINGASFEGKVGVLRWSTPHVVLTNAARGVSQCRTRRWQILCRTSAKTTSGVPSRVRIFPEQGYCQKKGLCRSFRHSPPLFHILESEVILRRPRCSNRHPL